MTVGFEWVQRAEQLVSGQSLSVAGSPVGYPTSTNSGPTLTLFTPLLLHAAPHFFVGAGPTIFHEFASTQGGPDVGGQRTTFGGHFLVGGWWGGPQPEPAAVAADAAPPARTRRYGDAHVVVLSNDFVAQVASTSYSGVPSSSTVASFQPALDVFLVDHVSLGIGVPISYSDVSGLDASSGANVRLQRTTVGLGPRLGLDLPLGRGVSLNPRGSVAYSYRDERETSGSNVNASQSSTVTLGLYIPVLLHPVSHVFVGLGPTASTDIVSVIAPGDRQNKASMIGVALTVGGWL